MPDQPAPTRNPLVLVLTLLLGVVVVLVGGATLLGGTKVRPLFGASADALAGGTRAQATARLDAGADAGR